eukprot:scaffold16308_cov55-Attheya_sp.AAC.2
MVTFISGVWKNVTKKIHRVYSDATPPEHVKTRGDETSSTTNTQSGSRHTSDSDHQAFRLQKGPARHDTSTAARDTMHLDTEVPSANKTDEITQITTQDSKSNDNHSKLPSALNSNTAARNTESHSETRHGKKWTEVEDALLRTLIETHGTQWKEIAQHFPGRSRKSVSRRYNRLHEILPVPGASSKTATTYRHIQRTDQNENDSLRNEDKDQKSPGVPSVLERSDIILDRNTEQDTGTDVLCSKGSSVSSSKSVPAYAPTQGEDRIDNTDSRANLSQAFEPSDEKGSSVAAPSIFDMDSKSHRTDYNSGLRDMCNDSDETEPQVVTQNRKIEHQVILVDLTEDHTAARDMHLDTEVPSPNKTDEITQITTQDKSNDNHSKLPAALSSKNIAARNTESHSETRQGKNWTDVEDALLLTLYETHGAQWSKIAQHFPGKSYPSVSNRCIRLSETRKGIRWANEEDTLLRTLCEIHGTQWTEIAQHLPGRSSESVERRWRRIIREPNSEADLIDMASSRNTSKRVATPPVMSKPRGDKVVASSGNLQKDLGSSW